MESHCLNMMKELTERQAEAALHHDQSLCVVAGAGTGKTHLLVRKYLDLLEKKGVAVSEILALTFTDKAAAEMKDRIWRSVLRREGLEEKQDDLLWANVSTFHSFCAQVLREFPIEAGVDPGFSVLDEPALRRIKDDCMLELLYSETDQNTAIVSVLRALSQKDLRVYLDTLSAEREYAESFFSILERDEHKILTAWEETVLSYRSDAIADLLQNRTFQTQIRRLTDLAGRYPGTLDSGMEYLRAIEPHLAVIAEDPSPETIISSITDLTCIHQHFKATTGQKKNWKGDDLVALRDAFKELRALLKEREESFTCSISPDDPFTQTTIAFLKNLGAVFSAYTTLVDDAKKRQNGLEFQDLIRHTHQLFTRDDALVNEHFRRRYRYILVDEYQDTDPIQSDIIARIIGDTSAPSERLFVVGDPKQSIYLFRRADVTQFRHTRDLIRDGLSGAEVSLDRNFRSTPEVMGFVNHLFSSLMAESRKPWEFSYQMLETERSSESGSVTLLLAQNGTEGNETTRSEAEMVARNIQSLISEETMMVSWGPDGSRIERPRPAGYGDIAILIERRTKLPVFEWALRRYGIPLSIHSGVGFYEQQEIIDLYLILSFLQNDADDVQLFGALRSPYFGLSDATLFHIREMGSSGLSLWRCLESYAEVHQGTDAADACLLLSSWKEYAGRLELTPLILRILSESGIYAVYGGMQGGEHAIANIEKLLGKARGTEATLAEFVLMMKLSIEDESQEGEAQIDLSSRNAVLIMTVHASKGLEFPVVVVPELARPIRYTGRPIMISDHLHLGVTIPDPQAGFERRKTPILMIQNDLHRQKEEAERRRLLYVAATRAKDHLILSGTRPKEVPDDLFSCTSRMDWIAHTLNLTDEMIENGSIEIIPPCRETPIQIRIISDPNLISAEMEGRKPKKITIQRDVLRGVTQETPIPIMIPEDEPTFSASGIEHLRSDLDAVHHQRRAGLAPKSETAAVRGTILHEVFQGHDIATVLRRRHGVTDPARARELETAYEKFCTSERMAGIIRDHCEVPFSTRAYGVLFRGTIDRLVQQPDNTWILIDYKTGVCNQQRIDSYQVQMAVYRQAAEAILGEPVTPYLYFTDSNQWIEVVIDEDKVTRLVEEARYNTTRRDPD